MKSLATGAAAIAGAAVLAGSATLGVTSAITESPVQAQTQLAVFGVPMPQAPAPDLQGPLLQTLNGLAGGGSFATKAVYIQGGLGPKDTFLADRAYNKYAEQGAFPVSFNVTDIDQNGGSATANVTLTTATGTTASQGVAFIAGPSPSGWQMSKGSVLSLLSSLA